MNRYVVETYPSEAGLIYRLEDKQSGSFVELLPSVGFNIVRYYADDTPIISAPARLSDLIDHSSKYGNALLCPPNFLREGRFRFAGKEYRFPRNDEEDHLHGELRDREWKVINVSEGAEGASITALYHLSRDEAVYRYYPHRLVFYMTYELKRGSLRHRGAIINEGTESAPFGLGFHPYFTCQEGDMIRLNVSKQYPFGGTRFVQGEPEDAEICAQMRKGMPVSSVPTSPPGFSLYALGKTDRYAEITRPNEGITVTYAFDPVFRFAALFKPSWSDAVSIEPYTCITDAFNSSMPEEQRGSISLKAGAVFGFENHIRVESITEQTRIS